MKSLFQTNENLLYFSNRVLYLPMAFLNTEHCNNYIQYYYITPTFLTVPAPPGHIFYHHHVLKNFESGTLFAY